MGNTARASISATIFLISAAANAASPAFQDFLFRACSTADAGSDFSTRCNIDSVNGDLSGDSEDSLNPTQSLANGAGAIAETSARIKALQDRFKDEPQRAEVSEGGVKRTFRMAGWSLIVNAEHGSIDREASLLERGYQTDSNRLQIGADYRLKDNWLLGAIVGMDRYGTDYDADQPGNNFVPGPSEGSSDRDAVSVSLFTASTVGKNGYVDAIVSWSQSDYTFRRIGIFQESSRTLPTRAVETSADTQGNELAVSGGISFDHAFGPNMLQWYARISHHRSTIDAYTEQGGAGFAMRVRNADTSETVGTAGIKYARSFNTRSGVIVPQLFVEYENAFNAKARQSTSSFVDDTSRNEFLLTGDAPDAVYSRIGVSLLGQFANGFSCFAGVNKVFSQDFIDEVRITAGLRVEF